MAETTTGERSGFIALAFSQAPGGHTSALEATVREILGTEARLVRGPQRTVIASLRVVMGTDLDALASRVRTAVQTMLPGQSVDVAVSSLRYGRGGASAAVLEATHSLAIRDIVSRRRTVVFEDLGAYYFVAGQPSRRLREFADRILGPLADPQGRREENLLETLDAYLRMQGNVSQVARRMALHRNTIRHRLRRVKTLTGSDLGDSDARLTLQMALLAMQVHSHIREWAAAS